MTADTVAVTDENGVLRFYGLIPGTYYLKEERTPSGYQLLAEVKTIVVAADGTVTVNEAEVTPVNHEISVTVTNQNLALDVPTTGFGGVLPYLIASMAVMLATFSGFVIYRKKRRF